MKEFMAMRVIKTCITLVATGLLFLSAYAGAAEGYAKTNDKKMYESVKACQKVCKSTRKDISNEAYEDCISKCWKDNQKDQKVPTTQK
jgi:hypothetical protein